MLRPLRAALFDLDGTLVHTAIDFDGMRRDMLTEADVFGVSTADLAGLDVLTLVDKAAARLSAPEADRFRERCERRLVEIELAAGEGATLAEGALEILDWLRKRDVRIGIVTRNSRQAVARLWEMFSLPHEVLLTRADTPRVKPDPLHLELALARLETAAADAVMVGDHLMDVIGGRAAGMRTVGVLLPERSPDYFLEAGPDHVIRVLPELRTWISRS